MKDENQALESVKDLKKMHLAVVGVSQDPQKYGHRIFLDLFTSGYHVVGVHPEGGVVANQKLCTALRQITPLPDMVITVVPPQATKQIVAECLRLGIPRIWMQPGSESAEAIEAAEKAGIEVVSQACFMKNQALW
jgi:predicted CoA-binding protein